MKTFEQIKSELREIAIPKRACSPGLDMWKGSKTKADLAKTIVAYYGWVMVSEEIISEEYLLENFTIDELAEGGLYYKDEDIRRLSDFWAKSIQVGSHHAFDNAPKSCPSGYRLPTPKEFCILIANTNYSFEDEHGVFEFKNGEKLVLPAAGYRNSDGTLIDVGTGGYYWSGRDGKSFLTFYIKLAEVITNDISEEMSILCVTDK